MYAAVACLKCAKSFQAPQAKLGGEVECPWCHQQTDAVPVAVQPEPLPLPLEDAPPAPRRKPPPRVGRLVFYLIGLVVLSVGVFAGQKYRGGYVPAFVLAESAADDGSYRATLPGEGRSAELTAFPGTALTRGRKTVAGSWWTRTGGEVGVYDLDADGLNLIRTEDLLGELRNRRADGWAATVEQEAVVKVGPHDGIEVRLASGSVRRVERYVLVRTGPRPRVCFVSVGGPHFDPDGAVARRVMGSLRVE